MPWVYQTGSGRLRGHGQMYAPTTAVYRKPHWEKQRQMAKQRMASRGWRSMGNTYRRGRPYSSAAETTVIGTEIAKRMGVFLAQLVHSQRSKEAGMAVDHSEQMKWSNEIALCIKELFKMCGVREGSTEYTVTEFNRLVGSSDDFIREIEQTNGMQGRGQEMYEKLFFFSDIVIAKQTQNLTWLAINKPIIRPPPAYQEAQRQAAAAAAQQAAPTQAGTEPMMATGPQTQDVVELLRDIARPAAAAAGGGPVDFPGRSSFIVAHDESRKRRALEMTEELGDYVTM